MKDSVEKLSKTRPVSSVRVPIRVKLTLPYLLLSIILAVVAAYLITQLVLENVEERFNKQLFEAGKISSELIVDYESELLATQRLLVNLEGVPSAVLDNDPNTLRSLTFGIIANDQQEAVEFLDAQGNHILSIRHVLGTNPENYEFSTGGQTEFSSLEIVQNVIQNKVDSRGDKYADLVQTEFGYYLYTSGPIYVSENEIAGVVLVGRSLQTIAADIRLKTFAQISFYDHSGLVLYSTLPFPQGLVPEFAVQTVLHKNTNSGLRDLSNHRVIDSANILYSEILGSWEVRGENQIGVLGASLNKNILVETSSLSRWRIFVLVATANFLIILIGINLANSITRPLIHLVQASSKVAQGDLTVKIDTETNDEVSVLTESFNKMVDSLNQSHTQLIRTYDETLEGWAKALELRDKETEGHSQRVTDLTIRLAKEIGVINEELDDIRRGALLHDIGKMGTPDAILHKEGALTTEERNIIQRHPQDAYEILSQIDYLKPALEIPYCHHEKWDGNGYPRGLKGEEIPLSARIFSIVDVFDALSNDRPYRKALPIDEIKVYLKEQSGKHFDPMIVNAFISLLDSN